MVMKDLSNLVTKFWRNVGHIVFSLSKGRKLLLPLEILNNYMDTVKVEYMI